VSDHSLRPLVDPRLRAAIAAALLLGSLVPAVRSAPAPAARRAPAARSAPAGPAPSELAVLARTKEELGAYGAAVPLLRQLRGRTALDGDLELALALDEARAGLADSAWARLNGPVLRAALTDSVTPGRGREYPFGRDQMWLDGRFTGWRWYVARARAELALRTRRWPEALAMARVAARDRPLSGLDQLLLAVAAGRAGDAATARAQAARAVEVNPLLPEAHYLQGLWAWRDGDRAAARAGFERAIGADSAFRPAAVALVRLRLPAARPDSLPSVVVRGARQVGLLTSPERPKPEENPLNDILPGLYGSEPFIPITDSLRARMNLTKPMQLFITVLVDPQGKPVLVELPSLKAEQLPAPLPDSIMHMASHWRFRPAVKLGRPVRSWASIQFMLYP
jgi:tetratricopeptide (TPR) repeat protein